MNWKLSISGFIISFLMVFPYNIIGCGGSEDPYDYYTSFFSQALSTDEYVKPFYYTGYRFLHDETEPVSTKEITSTEWLYYTNNEVSKTDVQNFILRYQHKQLSTLYFHIEKKQPLSIADSVKQNGLTKWLIKNKDLEALGYLMYTKQAEPFVTGDEDPWADLNRDSLKMGRLIQNGIQLWKVAKNNFIKLRYGYQIMRLAHYSGRYDDCISFYNLYVKENNTKSVLQDLCLSLKAGALKNKGQREEAAYEFSKLFAKSNLKRLSNYLSFVYSTQSYEDGNVTIKDVLKLCKTDKERAAVTAMFAMSGSQNKLQSLTLIYQLDPANPLLEVLLIREINKLEEKYLHPTLQKGKGEKLMYSWSLVGLDNNSPNYDSIYIESETETKALLEFCIQLSQNNLISNRGLYGVAAAYTAFMLKDLKKARELLTLVEKMSLTPKVKDQWLLTNLLVSINEQQIIDVSFEAKLLPSVQWLQQKAVIDEEWKKFYRNLLKEILATRYRQQKNSVREALCLGSAEKIMFNQAAADNGYYYGTGEALSFIRLIMNSREAEQLFTFIQSPAKTKWESYLTGNTSFSKDDVCDVAGTAYLRELDYSNAEKWFSKVSSVYYKQEPYKTCLAANPFADLIFDTHTPTKQDVIKYTKLSFVQKMKALKAQTTKGSNEEKAKAYYQMAHGFYQMSYWGNSWMLVEYGWSGNDGLKSTIKPGSWQYEYFGVFKAEEYYLKAKELTKDVNLKARCVWMASKCAQKQNAIPLYDDFKNDYNKYTDAWSTYGTRLKQNKYFELFVKDYKAAAFYKEAFNSCVYLKDYVKGR